MRFRVCSCIQIALLATMGAAGTACGVLGCNLDACSGFDSQMSPLSFADCDGECVSIRTVERCGGCDISCVPPPGEAAWCDSYGSSSTCRSAAWLARTTSNIEGLTADATYVYFAVPSEGLLQRVPRAGGETVTIAEGQPDARPLAVDDTHLYWGIDCLGAEACQAGAEVLRAPIGGGAVEVLAHAATPSASALAVEGSTLYWSAADHGLWRVDTAGGEATALVSDGSFGVLAVVGGEIFVAGTLEPDVETRDLYVLPVGGGTPSRLTHGLRVTSLAMDAQYLYVQSRRVTAYGSLRLADKLWEELLHTETDLGERSVPWLPNLVAWNGRLFGGGSDVGWFDVGERRVLDRIPTPGGASGLAAVDGTYVFFSGARSVLRVQLP